MKKAARSPPTEILTLRLWHETLGDGQREWRGEIKNLSTAEARYFRRWDEIAPLVRKMIELEPADSRSLPAKEMLEDE